MTAILFSMVGYFNGNNKTVWVMIQGLIQTLLVRLPLAPVFYEYPADNQSCLKQTVFWSKANRVAFCNKQNTKCTRTAVAGNNTAGF